MISEIPNKDENDNVIDFPAGGRDGIETAKEEELNRKRDELNTINDSLREDKYNLDLKKRQKDLEVEILDILGDRPPEENDDDFDPPPRSAV